MFNTHMKRVLGRVAAAIPFVLQRQLIECAIQRVFAEPLAAAELDFLTGRVVQIEVSDFAQSCMFSLRNGRLILCRPQRIADVVIAADLLVFTRLAVGLDDPDTLFFQRRLRVKGDTELGLAVKNTMDGIGAIRLPPALRSLLLRFNAG